MNKKYQIASAVLIISVLLIGGLAYIFYPKPKPVIVPARTLSYLVSKEDPLKYCNGADMDSAGYLKTITVEKSTTSPEPYPTGVALIKATIDAATTGMCREVLDSLDITTDNGIVYIPSFDAWAGVSITMCSCRPQVEVNLLRLPGITKVVWSAKAENIACTMDAKLCPDGSYVGRSGPKCEFAACPPASIAPYDSGVQGTVTLGPTCPVMRVGDSTCADKPYATNIQVIAIGSPKSSLFDTVRSDDTGKYRVMLPPGNYSLQPVGGTVLPRCETKDVTIEPSKIITVDLSCDSGIR